METVLEITVKGPVLSREAQMRGRTTSRACTNQCTGAGILPVNAQLTRTTLPEPSQCAVRARKRTLEDVFAKLPCSEALARIASILEMFSD